VQALDPLALDAAAAHPYRLAGEVGEVPFDLTAVILKGAVLDAPGVEASRRLSPAEGGQGLYVYRNDRLLQLGGWNSVIDGGRDYANLRISLDVGDALLDPGRLHPQVLASEGQLAGHIKGEELGLGVLEHRPDALGHLPALQPGTVFAIDQHLPAELPGEESGREPVRQPGDGGFPAS